MRRQQEVVTAILDWLENREFPWSEPPEKATDPISGKPVDPAVLRYHVDLCEQAGFIRSKSEGRLRKIQLTWKGQEELETRRVVKYLTSRSRTTEPEDRPAAG